MDSTTPAAMMSRLSSSVASVGNLMRCAVRPCEQGVVICRSAVPGCGTCGAKPGKRSRV